MLKLGNYKIIIILIFLFFISCINKRLDNYKKHLEIKEIEVVTTSGDTVIILGGHYTYFIKKMLN